MTIVAVSAVAADALRVVACPLRATVGCTNEEVSPANESTAAHKLTPQIPFFDGIVLGSGASFSVSLRYPGVRQSPNFEHAPLGKTAESEETYELVQCTRIYY